MDKYKTNSSFINLNTTISIIVRQNEKAKLWYVLENVGNPR